MITTHMVRDALKKAQTVHALVEAGNNTIVFNVTKTEVLSEMLRRDRMMQGPFPVPGRIKDDGSIYFACDH